MSSVTDEFVGSVWVHCEFPISRTILLFRTVLGKNFRFRLKTLEAEKNKFFLIETKVGLTIRF
ncbi:hypothetical protein LEP1GSC060_0171 [Leptospira weilii serovar Ranarum str. ICFT]|uniref:Uncharacterized protein n=1 Tax=Leptospira weilii serovar Ranarum str. ICFT TaxID=1218598 RepID=N1WBC1_9LEPT|nr:hypothetical protein LEP1GSC060_0171 [Leptospira weilii serovar Ranarum str. ICFT]